MTRRLEIVSEQLKASPKTWLVTGAAGFIGSHCVEFLLKLGQQVVALDNFATGYRHNLDHIATAVGSENYSRLKFIEGDIRDAEKCNLACAGVDFVLHQAALGSVPRSIEDPTTSNAVNVDGFINMALAARAAKVKKFVYASSSSVYGDHPELPKFEDKVGEPLSPYAVTKKVNELYASVFSAEYGIKMIGLRYFNVFGARQDPNGAYAAVIPRWLGELLAGGQPKIFGDGTTSRDFCYISNVVEANVLAATADLPDSHRVYNVSFGDQTDLNQLYAALVAGLEGLCKKSFPAKPLYETFRSGDIKHSLADTSRARSELGYAPLFSLEKGLEQALAWYVNEYS